VNQPFVDVPIDGSTVNVDQFGGVRDPQQPDLLAA
jgi:hypothetical protein